MKGVVLWISPDRDSLTGSTNTNEGFGINEFLTMSITNKAGSTIL
jgi:hypothetical protein